jgi:hypothetical protein
MTKVNIFIDTIHLLLTIVAIFGLGIAYDNGKIAYGLLLALLTFLWGYRTK